MNDKELVIQQTKKWVELVVIGCNFCPFAAKEVRHDKVHYEIDLSEREGTCLSSFANECKRLDENDQIETSLLIFPNAVPGFYEYLKLLESAEKYLMKNDYEGVYQVASFHPLYCFEGSNNDDPANYTNRSVYPMLHLLRESSVELALKKYSNPDNIPERNIHFARQKGLVFMKTLRDACL